jgi:hypothetical protein
MCNERLNNLYQQRDAIETALGSGKDFIELEIRGRRVRKQDATKTLEYLNQEIEKLERAARQSRGPARNVARVRR